MEMAEISYPTLRILLVNGIIHHTSQDILIPPYIISRGVKCLKKGKDDDDRGF